MRRQSRNKKQRRIKGTNSHSVKSRQKDNDPGELPPPSRSNNKPPDIQDEIKKRIFQQFGRLGLIVLALICFAVYAWWDWEHAKTVPGLGYIVEWMDQDPIPLADPARFSIAVSHLQGDLEGDPHERLVVEALKEVHGIEILRFDRTIYLEDSRPQQSEEAGHDRAQRYLRESGADVLIWGAVLSAGNKNVLKLHWTINAKHPVGWRRYQPTENLNLPELFWGDLSTILVFLVAAHHEQYKEGSFVADHVTAHITKVRKLLEDKGQSWKPEFRLVLKLLLALSSSIVAEQTNKGEFLQEAVLAYRSALQEISSAQKPQLWAWIQNNLGLDLVALSDRVTGTRTILEAVLAFQEALQVRKRDRLPLEWARTQSNLGHAIRILSERERGSKKLKEAIEILRSALEEQIQKNAPSDRARTQNRLASALLSLGERENQAERLREAEEAVREALKQWTPEATPLMWAGAQINLGNILQALGAREPGTQRLEEAVAAYQAAQRYFTRDRSPLSWALAQNNLGNTLKLLGEREGSTTRLKEAIRTLQEALEERSRKIVPFDWAQTQVNVGLVLTSLAMREEGIIRLEQAIRAYRTALEIIQRERMPLDWARVQLNLGITLRILGARQNNQKIVCDGLQSHHSAWKVFSDWNITYESSIAANALTSTIQTLEKQFSPQEASRCVAKTAQAEAKPRDGEANSGERVPAAETGISPISLLRPLWAAREAQPIPP